MKLIDFEPDALLLLISFYLSWAVLNECNTQCSTQCSTECGTEHGAYHGFTGEQRLFNAACVNFRIKMVSRFVSSLVTEIFTV